MEEAEVVHAELDRHFASEVAAARVTLAEAQQRLDDWRRTGALSRPDVIAAWKSAAANALAVALSGQDPRPAIERVQAVRRWLHAQGYWPEDADLPTEVEVALRKALRTSRA